MGLPPRHDAPSHDQGRVEIVCVRNNLRRTWRERRSLPLAVPAQPKGREYADLVALSVKTVIDLQEDGNVTEGQLVESAGMKFYRIPMTTHEAPTREELTLFLRLVNDPANQPVYVHCAGGRHRTGVMTAFIE